MLKRQELICCATDYHLCFNLTVKDNHNIVRTSGNECNSSSHMIDDRWYKTLRFDVSSGVFRQDLPYFYIIKEGMNELVPFFHSDFVR